MAYLTLFLGHITNMALMREFLKFLVVGKYDDRSVVNVILNSINSTSVNVRTHYCIVRYVMYNFHIEQTYCMF